MNETDPGDLIAAHERITQQLGHRLSLAEREEVKAAIIALFHDTDRALAELTEFKESIRELVARFKALPTLEAPPVAAVAPPINTVRHDHLGASSHIERGWSALAVAHWPDAEMHLRRALALDGTSVTARALLGWALMYRGREDDALQLVPGDSLAHVVIGAICLRKGIIAEAIEHLSRVAVSHGDPRAVLYANYWLGVAYLDRGMPSDAEEVLRRAITLGPNLGEGWLELGHVLWRRNRTGEARDAWARGARAQHSPHAVACRQMLDTVASGGVPTRSPPR